ncbi:MAG: dual specificity protein phosphatase family protein [Chloroflexi bacterium]|nr:dual specificity protein phosphatase family protein [Chloroflexota bacterium]
MFPHLAEVLPGLYIRMGHPDGTAVPSNWARLEVRDGPIPDGPPDTLHLPVPDDAIWSDGYIEQVVEFIRSRLRRGQPVVVGCVAGVSRSPSAALAYMVDEYGLSVEEGLERLREAYPRANPSPVILDSLREYFAARRDGA